MRLQSYSFKVERVRGVDNCMADTLSRLTLEAHSVDDVTDYDISSLMRVENHPITIKEIKEESQKDSLCLDVKLGISSGIWPESTARFKGARPELTMWRDMVMFNNRFMVPWTLRHKTLQIAHKGHVGASSMKRLLRTFVWWPGMTSDIDRFYASCRGCLLISKPNQIPELSPRRIPKEPMEQVHIDFLKLTGVAELLVVTDAFSRYLWTVEMKKTTAEATNRALMKVLSQWKLPALIQSDNGPQFVSEEFKKFWEKKGVKTRTTIPYASHTNGLVERHNRGIIRAVSAGLTEKGKWRDSLKDYLRNYNSIPHSSTGFPPFQLLQGKRYHEYLPICTDWDGEYEDNPIWSEAKRNDKRAKAKQKKAYDLRNRACEITIKEGDWVVMQNQRRATKMESRFLQSRFRVMRMVGPRVVVRSEDGTDYLRWVGHLKLDTADRSEFPEAQVNKETILECPESEGDEAEQDDTTTGQQADNDKEVQIQEPARVSKTFNLRDRRLLSRPARYLDVVCTVID